nr:hypothetical protein GCM10020185_16150 [Pseudomonas brassicacearum subsp. brassicacearum]
MQCVGAVECNEAAIFPQTLESQAKDQKIAGFASSYKKPTPLTRDLPYTSLRKGSNPVPPNVRRKATFSCASAYNYARIRRLVRLGAPRYFLILSLPISDRV